MKKLFVAASLLIGLFGSNCFAASAPAAYYWDIAGIRSTAGDHPNTWEDVGGSTYSTTWNHDGTTYAVVLVLGYSNPVTTYNNSPMQFLGGDPLDLNNDGTIDGWAYYYATNSYVYSGNVKVKDWLNSSYGTRDSIFVQ
jgi:hypothetical protein